MSAPGSSNAGLPKILVVEDEEDLRRLLTRVLGTVGDIRAAADGLEAYELLTSGYSPDLIVTDLMMPRMDGLALAQKLKTHATLSKVPIVMLTAKTSAKDVITGINAGARHYVTKPFKTEELVGKVRKALAGKAK